MRRILIVILILNNLCISGCTGILQKSHDKQIKSSCDVCKEPPFYVDGKRLHETRGKH